MPQLRREYQKITTKPPCEIFFGFRRAAFYFSVIYFEGISDIYGDGNDGYSTEP